MAYFEQEGRDPRAPLDPLPVGEAIARNYPNRGVCGGWSQVVEFAQIITARGPWRPAPWARHYFPGTEARGTRDLTGGTPQ